MKILIIEPFFTGSHKKWMEGYREHSAHTIDFLTLEGRHWKWRMHGAALTLARQFSEMNGKPDRILATDMLDVCTFKALLPADLQRIPLTLYFHENQLTYPKSERDTDRTQLRDNHYGFINYTSCLAADRVFFNSNYHLNNFLSALEVLLKKMPDHQELQNIKRIRKKSEVLHLGMDLQSLNLKSEQPLEKPERAVVLWNHRWEYDKNPEAFFKALFNLQEHGIDFRLSVLGEQFRQQPGIFAEAREKLGDKIIHWGFAEDKTQYVRLLHQADILPVTSNQDFFGGSVVEAMYCNVIPLLPNRLAYSEHIPSYLNHTFFYETDHEMEQRLQRLMFNLKVIRKQKVQQFVEKYDWGKMARVYDSVMETTAS